MSAAATRSPAGDAAAHPAELLLVTAIAFAASADKSGCLRRKPGEAVEEYLTVSGAKVASCGEAAGCSLKTNLLVRRVPA
jgi:hypothetical protein